MSSHFKINLTPDPLNTWIELNGARLGMVSAFAVSIDVKTSRPVVTMTLHPDSVEGVIHSDSEQLNDEQKAQLLAMTQKALDANDVQVNVNQHRLNMRRHDNGSFSSDGTQTHISIVSTTTKKTTT